MDIETPEDENLLEALIWNLQMPPEMSDNGAGHNMRVAKDRLRKALAARDALLRADERQKAAGEWEKLTEHAGVKLDAVLEPIKKWLESLPNGATKDIATNYLHYTQLGFDCWHTAKAQLHTAVTRGQG